MKESPKKLAKRLGKLKRCQCKLCRWYFVKHFPTRKLKEKAADELNNC